MGGEKVWKIMAKIKFSSIMSNYVSPHPGWGDIMDHFGLPSVGVSVGVGVGVGVGVCPLVLCNAF